MHCNSAQNASRTPKEKRPPKASPLGKLSAAKPLTDEAAPTARSAYSTALRIAPIPIRTPSKTARKWLPLGIKGSCRRSAATEGIARAVRRGLPFTPRFVPLQSQSEHRTKTPHPLPLPLGEVARRQRRDGEGHTAPRGADFLWRATLFTPNPRNIYPNQCPFPQ